MSEISNLLNDAQSTYRNQIAETKKYVSKWEKTGLLEGIDLDYEKHNYLYFVASTTNPGYHLFAKNLREHNKNKKVYTSWLRKQNIYR